VTKKVEPKISLSQFQELVTDPAGPENAVAPPTTTTKMPTLKELAEGTGSIPPGVDYIKVLYNADNTIAGFNVYLKDDEGGKPYFIDAED
jgi:hypothetical protein